jgi:cyclophilin family peptidyl-prolyl cis-trans isomerase
MKIISPFANCLLLFTIITLATPLKVYSDKISKEKATSDKVYREQEKNMNQEFNQKNPPKAGDTIAIIETNQGTMKAIIFVDIVPSSAKNFIELAKQGKYSDVPFHRVIENFMIQGGDFTNKNGSGGHSAKGPNTTISDEYSPQLSHIRGAVAWAKTSLPNSIGSQFYIVHPGKGAHFLDHPANGGPAEGYSVFGQIYEGFEVLDKIATSETGAQDKPLQPMTIKSISINEYK